MRRIDGDAKSIRGMLGGSKFAIDYYQREYRWETKQVAELLEDLAEKFLESHEPTNERSAVEQYGHYFLGSIIISDKDGQKFIIDGQQRLTSMTLLLIHLHRQLEDPEQKAQLADLIFSQKFGKRSFNLDVPERTPCMDALFTGEPFDDTGQPESVVNILARFQDIEEGFPDELAAEALPYFADWLIENVHFVEITAYSDADAYTIFETMNDRGLSLTPTDMLKGYEVEHIWANHADRHTDEFAHPTDFAEYRNRIGGLLLLPKSFNASYGDKPYAEKREHYFGQNLLAQSLHETAYDHNPGFRKFREESGLGFQPHNEFKKADLDARQALYREIAEQIWSPDALQREVEA